MATFTVTFTASFSMSHHLLLWQRFFGRRITFPRPMSIAYKLDCWNVACRLQPALSLGATPKKSCFVPQLTVRTTNIRTIDEGHQHGSSKTYVNIFANDGFRNALVLLNATWLAMRTLFHVSPAFDQMISSFSWGTSGICYWLRCCNARCHLKGCCPTMEIVDRKKQWLK